MDAKIIINKINAAINNINKANFINNFPMILDDLNYIYFDLPNDTRKMSSVEQFTHGSEIEIKLMEYFAKLAKTYMRVIRNMKVQIECSDEYSMSIANAGYDSTADVIKYSTFGMILGKQNQSSYLQTYLHEGRHKKQHDIYNSTELEKIINFDGNGILLLKEDIYEMFHQGNNRKFYQDNYDLLYRENDAEVFSIEELKSFIMNMYVQYAAYASNNDIKIDDELIEKAIKVNAKIQQDGLQLEEDQQRRGRINSQTIEELSGTKPITSVYIEEDITVDKMIALDKTIKAHPELQMQNPILKLLFNGNVPKTYEEIIRDRQSLIMNHLEDSSKIKKLYNDIINSDPMLYLTELVLNNNIEKIADFILEHPTLFDEYPNEIQYISTLTNNEEIYILLSNDNGKKR